MHLITAALPRNIANIDILIAPS